LFVALAMAVVFSLLASYVIAVTVVPLFCAKLIKKHLAGAEVGEGSIGTRFGAIAKKFNAQAAEKLHQADRDQMYPTISALAAYGDSPIRDDLVYGPYEAIGVNVLARANLALDLAQTRYKLGLSLIVELSQA
jgi:hypothetical protein